VTILKPLCGAEHELYECLRSFCDQDYPRFQIVFGVSDGRIPPSSMVARLAASFRTVDIQLAVDRRQHGTSRKVSNLINMMPLARHDLSGDFGQRCPRRPRLPRSHRCSARGPAVGIVTCPYLGRPRKGLWSLLGSLFINDWFTPSVRVAAMFGSRAFAFGATIAIRRHVLRRIGGFASIANQLADDYRLMKTLFLQPPSFDGFDGGAGSRYQARREIKSFWFPTWLAQPAALVPGSKLIDAPPARLGLDTVLTAARAHELCVIHTSTPSFASDVKVAAALKDANPSLKIGFVGAKVAVQPTESLAQGLPIDFVARNEFDFTIKEVAEGRDWSAIDGIRIATTPARSCTTRTARSWRTWTSCRS
jgi:hypothetical protein